MDNISLISIHSLFLAQVLGLYMVIMAIIMICRRNLYQSFLTKTDRPSLALVVWGSLGLIIGILLVAVHNIWVMTPQVLVTLVAWYVLIKSILWLSLPEKMITLTHRMNMSSWFYVRCAVIAIIGILLLAKGYYLYLDADYLFWPKPQT